MYMTTNGIQVRPGVSCGCEAWEPDGPRAVE